MNKQEYKKYLKTEHWKNFRKEILSLHNICQNCNTKKGIHLHHRNYNSFYKETNKDILVFCGECHFCFHDKKRWKKAMRKGEDLHFTGARASKRGKKRHDNLYKARSNIFQFCRWCGEEHSIFYRMYNTVGLRLAMVCPNSKPRTKFLPMKRGLDIPTEKKYNYPKKSKPHKKV